ncbi:MAG: response regulator [Deltaproteobacteria bacterium]|nr:response regulator [Deltaproteobacteria bacterium]
METLQGKKAKILVVEDSEVQAAALRHVLEQQWYEVVVATDGSEGLRLARKERPALIISDILMPVMDGWEMCGKIKESAELKDTPLMLLTQLTEPEEVIRGLEAGADNYITKPFDADFLVSKVRALLENPEQFRNRPERQCIEFEYGGKRYSVRSGRAQTLAFLLSTYENAVLRTAELGHAQEELGMLNAALDVRVQERTADLDREVEERKRAEETLRESEERFRALMESASDAFVALEPPGRIYLWNRKAEEMFGYTAAEAVGKDFHDLVVPERFRKAASGGLDVFFRTGKGAVVGNTVELDALRRDGTEFKVELSVSAVNVRGRWNSIGVIRDVTGRKRLEAELRQNLEELSRMNRLMIGRELKMEDLRQEVRALRERVRKLETGTGAAHPQGAEK